MNLLLKRLEKKAVEGIKESTDGSNKQKYGALTLEKLDAYIKELSKRKKEEERSYVISMNYKSAIQHECEMIKRFKPVTVKMLRRLHEEFTPGYIYTLNTIDGWSKQIL